jgi:DNA-binding NtrC family response regulator
MTPTDPAPHQAPVLLIDDEPAVLFAIGEYFGEHGLRTERAADAVSARRLVAERNYRLVVADLTLGPDQIDPLEVISELRLTRPDLPVMVLTGCGSPEVRRRALELGVFAFVQKPAPLSQVLELARLALSEPRRGP